MCWVAGIVPLFVGIPLVGWMLYLPFYWTTAGGGDDPVPILLPLNLIPLVLAIIAWKRHLAGGILLIAFAALTVTVGILSFAEEGTHDFQFLTPIGAVLLMGGMLHIFTWFKEARTIRPRDLA